MKTRMILTLLSLSLLLACNSDSVTSFIPGTYVNHSVGSYSLADDTLVIRNSGNGNYAVHRKTGFNLIRDGKTGKREHETEDWHLVYEKETGGLQEIRRGKTLMFYPDSNQLVIGERVYQKIN